MVDRLTTILKIQPPTIILNHHYPSLMIIEIQHGQWIQASQSNTINHRSQHETLIDHDLYNDHLNMANYHHLLSFTII